MSNNISLFALCLSISHSVIVMLSENLYTFTLIKKKNHIVNISPILPFLSLPEILIHSQGSMRQNTHKCRYTYTQSSSVVLFNVYKCIWTCPRVCVPVCLLFVVFFPMAMCTELGGWGLKSVLLSSLLTFHMGGWLLSNYYLTFVWNDMF